MTIDEAAKSWGIKPKTVLNYIYQRYIAGLKTDNNEIIIPDIPKPLIVGKKSIKSELIYKNILAACNNKEYINAKIFGITEEDFQLYMKELEKSECISRQNENADLSSNLSWIITLKGIGLISGNSNKTFLKIAENLNLNFGSKQALANF